MINYDKIKLTIYSGKIGLSKNFYIKRHNKIINSGGSGGNSGNVYIQVIDKLEKFDFFNKNIKFIANSGSNGGNNFKKGKNGKDLIIKIPYGTIIKNLKDNKNIINIYDKFDKYNKVLILKGNSGVKITKHNKNRYNKNYTKKNITKNINNEFLNLYKIELLIDYNILTHLILIGFPNSGKSSFINIITNKKSYIKDYNFSTLYPVIGTLRFFKNTKKIFILDLPGIIKNSFNGVGLGLNFLKYVKRTKILLNFIDIHLYLKYNVLKIITTEVYKYNKYYFYTPGVIFMNKIDLIINFFNKTEIYNLLRLNNFFYYNLLIISKKYICFNKIFYIFFKNYL